METRFKMGKVQPDAYKAMSALDDYVDRTDFDPAIREMIRLRASQINGCSYCVSLHSHDARKVGVSEQKTMLVSAWKEAENVFSEEERIAFEMTEEITLIHQHGLSQPLYEKAIAAFGEKKTAQIIMTIITINAWNRIGVGLKMQPELLSS
ncbi:MAG: hypothetical protein C5B52_08440 [Bacteroidetes bacterium]|nr:MAG: hypothetical protein C5B52_08440 [Bacteroidota bacterium]